MFVVVVEVGGSRCCAISLWVSQLLGLESREVRSVRVWSVWGVALVALGGGGVV